MIHEGIGSAGPPEGHPRPACSLAALAGVVRGPCSCGEEQDVRHVETAMAIAARQPKCASMNPVSQFHGLATISTGGAAKCVSVPPIETLTKSNPRVAYFRRPTAEIEELLRQQQRADRHRSGLGDEGAEHRSDRQDGRTTTPPACGLPAWQSVRALFRPRSMIGLVDASTMMTTTKIGSV